MKRKPISPKLLLRHKWKTKIFAVILVGFCFSTLLLMDAQYSRIGASSLFPQFVQKPKIAFLFLARNRLPLDLVWDEFFQGENENRFSIYVHSRPGFLLNRLTTRSRYFLDRQVNNSIQIYWGEASMIQAEIILLQHALMDPFNERFAFLSDSCIPLYNFSYTYDYIMSTSTSFVDSFADTKEGRYNPKMDPVIPVNNWRKGSQWVILTRKHAEIIVKDEVVFPMFQQHCQRKSLPEFWRDRPVVVSELTVCQMARCRSGYLNRRTAERGNDKGASGLFNREVEQVRQLPQLILGLGKVELIGRLQHPSTLKETDPDEPVRDESAGDEEYPLNGGLFTSTWKETEPEEPVWDELTGDEEHPTNDDTIYDSPPTYDEYEDEEWYSWASGGVIDTLEVGQQNIIILNIVKCFPEVRGSFDRDIIKKILFEGSVTNHGGVHINMNFFEDYLDLDRYGLPHSQFKIMNTRKFVQEKIEVCGDKLRLKYHKQNKGDDEFFMILMQVSRVHNLLMRKLKSDGGLNGRFMDIVGAIHFFERVQILTTGNSLEMVCMNRPDVPFDPGGLARKQNSRTSFFLRRGV